MPTALSEDSRRGQVDYIVPQIERAYELSKMSINRLRSASVLTVLLAAAAVPLAACGGEDGAGAGGTNSTMTLHSGESIEIFIPDGWTEKKYDSVGRPGSSTSSVSIVPEDEFDKPSVKASYTMLDSMPCDLARKLAIDAVTEGMNIGQPFPKSVGFEASISESEVHPDTSYASVGVSTAIPLSNGQCTWALIGAGDSLDSAAVATQYLERMRPIVKSMAINSRASD